MPQREIMSQRRGVVCLKHVATETEAISLFLVINLISYLFLILIGSMMYKILLHVPREAAHRSSSRHHYLFESSATKI